MRKAYERVANDWGFKSFPPKELAMKVAELCEKIADTELAEQAKKHAGEMSEDKLITDIEMAEQARDYERAISSLVKEIATR